MTYTLATRRYHYAKSSTELFSIWTFYLETLPGIDSLEYTDGGSLERPNVFKKSGSN